MPLLGALIPLLYGILVSLFWAGASLLAEFIGRAVSRWLPSFLTNLVGGWAQDAGNFVRQQMAGTIDSLAANMASIASAPAGAMDQLFSATATTLWNFRIWIHDIVDRRLPDLRNYATQWALILYNQAVTIIAHVQAYLLNYIAITQRYLVSLISLMFSLAIQRINQLASLLFSYINTVRTQLLAYIGTVRKELITYDNDLYNKATSYTRSVYFQLAAIIAAASAALIAYITSVSTWITTTVIPAAITAYNLLITGQIAAAMDIMWPFIYRSLGLSAVRLLLSAPLVSARVLAVPPEPVPGIAGGLEAVTGAVSYLSAVTESIVTPMWTKLHEFADEESSFSDPLLIAGIFAYLGAATIDPKGTADATDLVLGEPLSVIAQGAVDAINAL